MPGCKDGGFVEREVEIGFELGAAEEGGAAEVIERGCAGVMDATGFFAHGDDALAGDFG